MLGIKLIVPLRSQLRPVPLPPLSLATNAFCADLCYKCVRLSQLWQRFSGSSTRMADAAPGYYASVVSLSEKIESLDDPSSAIPNFSLMMKQIDKQENYIKLFSETLLLKEKVLILILLIL